jgi:predicted esterase
VKPRAVCLLLALSTVLAAAAVRDEAGVITAEDGKTAIVTYAARIPTPGPRDPAPGLIVALHGINGNEQQLVDPISKALQAAKREGAYMVLGLKSKGAGWEDVDHQPIRDAVAWAIRVHHVDPRRVFAWGYSHGAIRLGHFAAQAEDLFAGAVLWSGTCDKLPADGAGLAYYVVHGDKDPTVKPDNIRAARDRMRTLGIRLVYHELAGGDHGAAFSIGRPLWPDHIQWLDALRNARQPEPPGIAAWLEKAGAEFDKDGKLSAATAKGFPLLGEAAGPATDALLVKLLQAKTANLRRGAATLCTPRLYGDRVIAALIAMIDDNDHQTQAEVIKALALAADLGIAPAQEALCNVVTTHRSVPLRNTALEALLPALRNQKADVAFDPPFATLLDALGKQPTPALRKILDELRGGK